MSERVAAWIRQSLADLAHARKALAEDSHDWTCYAASQAAEKALKAGLLALGAESVWGHNLVALLDRIGKEAALEIPRTALDDARVLTQFNVMARYPVGDETIAPSDLLTRAQAVEAVAAAERMIDLVQTHVLGT
ncbi:HEPN domain-containing protein [Azospirillum halopraeferens]|uniref:HEPN domain-containing protein n=1 Tax=Azospirillum halopraeferens TaxID=34010 RepID=UPI00048E735D|nr:HEPN domain-containing protein [Azospirillum halopraeferens]